MNYKDFIAQCEKEIKPVLDSIDEQTFRNTEKVLNAFHNNNVSEIHFSSTTGYGYDDVGREKIDQVFAEVLGAEDAIVRNQFVSGSHALCVALFALLRPGDTMLTIIGEPYDTLKEVIGIIPNNSSLQAFGVKYEQIDLVNNDFNDEAVINAIKNKKYKLVHIQRSRGYSTRESLTIDKVERIIKKIREVDKDIIIFVDNCYCELVSEVEPVAIGADIMVGSLIKNLGGGIAPNGAYIAGKKKYIDLAGERLTLPGEGRDVGPTLGINRDFLRGLYFAPQVVGSSLKLAALASYALEKLGYTVTPKYDAKRADIVDMITFGDEEKMIKFVQGIQKGSAIDAHALAMPVDMPGYAHKIIMASGSFVQGSSIEISCDGPIKAPYIAYLQGGLTYDYAKLALIKALEEMDK